MNLTKNRWWMQAPRTYEQFLLTSGTRLATLGTNSVINRTIRTYPWSFVTPIFRSGLPSHCDGRNTIYQSDDFNLTNRNPSYSSFPYHIKEIMRGTTSPGILNQLKGKYCICRWCKNVAEYKMKIEIISFVDTFVLKCTSRSISMCKALYEADLAAYVVFFLSSSVW